MKNINSYLIGTILVSFLMGCGVDELDFENIYVPSAKPSLATELGTINYTIGELLAELESDDFIIDSSDASIIKLAFKDSLVITKADFLDDADLAQFEDVEETKILRPFKNLDMPITNPTTEPVTIDLTDRDLIDTLEYEFEQDTEKQNTIEQIFYSGGTLSITSSSVPGVVFDYTLLALNTQNTNTGNPLSFASSTGNATQVRNLANFNSSFDGTPGITTSRFVLKVVSATLEPLASVTNATTVQLDILTSDIDINTIAAIYGGFARDTIEIPGEELKFDALDEFSSGTFKFNDPSIKIDVVNYLGVPMTVDLSRITADTKDGVNIPLNVSASEGELDFVKISNPPVVSFDQIVPVNDVIKIDKTNSDIVSIVSSLPSAFNFPVSAIINAEGATTGQFAALPDNDTDTILSLITTVELPFDISFSNVEYPIDLKDIGLGDDITEIDSAHIKVVADNGLPLRVSVRIGFVDASGQEFGELTESSVLLRPSMKSEEILGLKKSELDNLLKAQDLKVYVSISSPESAVIGVGQTLKMTLSALVNPTIDL